MSAYSGNEGTRPCVRKSILRRSSDKKVSSSWGTNERPLAVPYILGTENAPEDCPFSKNDEIKFQIIK